MPPKRKITFTNSSIEKLTEEVQLLEDDTHYSLGSVKNAYWAHSLYAQFHDDVRLEDSMFPIQMNNFKPFLLELSKVYPYRTLQAVYLNLRRAWGIFEKIAILPPMPEVSHFFKLLKTNYGERIVGSKHSVANKRRPLLPSSVYTIIDNLDFSSVGIRDASLILTNMVIGQRCDYLQFVLIKHIDFKFWRKKREKKN